MRRSSSDSPCLEDIDLVGKRDLEIVTEELLIVDSLLYSQVKDFNQESSLK